MALPELPETSLSRAVDPVLAWIGLTTRWIWPILMSIVVINVALRYVFGEGRVELEELQWHLNSIGFLAAVAYGYRVDAHIRIDLLSARLRRRAQVWIEFYGILLLLLPFIALVLYFSVPFVYASFEVGEISQSPGGLPYRWILKGALPFGFLLLLAAVCSRLSRVWAYLTEIRT